MAIDKRFSVLLIVGNQSYREELTAEFAGSRFDVTVCNQTESAYSLLAQQQFHLVFCEEWVPENLRRAVRNASHWDYTIPIIVVSCQNDWSSYLDAIRSGAFDRLVLPAPRGELRGLVRAALKESTQFVSGQLAPNYDRRSWTSV